MNTHLLACTFLYHNVHCSQSLLTSLLKHGRNITGRGMLDAQILINHCDKIARSNQYKIDWNGLQSS